MENALKEVIEMEENYWKYVFETNIEAYLNLWHDDFNGWPRAYETPIGKNKLDSVGEQIQSYSQMNWDYTIENMSVNPVDSSVIAIYSVNVNMQIPESADKVSKTMRVIHVWKKQGQDWKIIGGMDTGFIE